MLDIIEVKFNGIIEMKFNTRQYFVEGTGGMLREGREPLHEFQVHDNIQYNVM